MRGSGGFLGMLIVLIYGFINCNLNNGIFT